MTNIQELFGSKKENEEKRNSILESISFLENKRNSKSVMICSHNSILVIKDENEKITHVIHPEKDRGLVMIQEINHFLAVPRYTPETAKAWLQDETAKITGGNSELTAKMKKAVVSERELEEAVFEQLNSALEYYNRILKLY